MPITTATTPMHSAPAHSLSAPRSRRNRPGLSASAALSRGGGTGRNTNFQFPSGRNCTIPSLLSGLRMTDNTSIRSAQAPHVTNTNGDTRQGSSLAIHRRCADNRDFSSSNQKSYIPLKTTSSLVSASCRMRHSAALPRTSSNIHRPSGDRFIPNRAHIRVDLCRANIASAGQHNYVSSLVAEDAQTRLRSKYHQQMKGALLNIPHEELSTRMLPFRQGNQASSQADSSYRMDPYALDQLRVLEGSPNRKGVHAFSSTRSLVHKVGRNIPSLPTRMLDAPGMVDDFYANILSWGGNNVLAIGLGESVYLWDAMSGDAKLLLTLEDVDDYVTSVSWATTPVDSHCIAVGTKKSSLQLWDANVGKKIRSFDGHSSHVGSLSWNQHFLSSGGGDSTILQHDIGAPTSHVATYTGHTQGICGLKWNDEGTTLASGGNDNVVCLWDAAMSRRDRNSPRSMGSISPQFVLTDHTAAVKALAWCPLKRGLLASGGGEGDGTIKFWNTNTGSLQNSINTGSQVCSLLWSKHQKEICSSHGGSENQLSLWQYPTMSKIQDFKGHEARVLNMEQSPESGFVVSASADETLHFWDMFGSSAPKEKDCFGVKKFMMGMPGIR
eukprot:scaffold23834_cov55-Attheya_sp.AAC.1